MEISKELIGLLLGAGVFFLVLSLFALQHAGRAKNIKSGHTWLFENWQDQMYDAIFGRRDVSAVGKSFSFDAEKYKKECALIQRQERSKAVIIEKICGYAIIIVGAVICIVTKNIVFLPIALAVAFPLISLPVLIVEETAEKQRRTVADELPRFLDMLHTALLIGMPVDQAIDMTAQSLPDTVLAKELQKSLADTRVGAYSWQKALERLAQNYNVDTLSDFVLDITNAYSLGSSILDSVARKSRDIKQTNLVAMKERASKLTNTILFPIVLFKMIPLLAIMIIPILLQLKSSGF